MHVAATRPRFADVRRIAVLRGGGLGDLLFALPAMGALAAAYPEAEIVLLGSPAHRALIEGRPSPVARVEELPVAPGVRDEPGRRPDGRATLDEFRRRVLRDGAIDLGVQLHGGGRNSNPFQLALAPRHTVGSATPDAAPLERTLPYVYYQHEVMRGLEVAGLAGARPVTLEPRIVVTDRDRAAASAYLPTGDRPFVVVHPGATDPRRRWPPGSFARLAVGVLDAGASVVLLGDEGDRARCAGIAERVAADRPEASARLTDVSGLLPIGATAAILDAAHVVVANDSGPRHLAQAVGAATVGVFWFGNVINAAPFSRERHRVHLSFTVRCPVCGIDVTQVGWTAPRCEHDESLVADVDPAAVLGDALDLMARSSPRSAPRAVPGSRSRRAG